MPHGRTRSYPRRGSHTRSADGPGAAIARPGCRLRPESRRRTGRTFIGRMRSWDHESSRGGVAWSPGCRTAATCSRRSPPWPTPTACTRRSCAPSARCRRARLAFYDQTSHEYGEFAVDAPVELVALLGNVSRRDGATAVHAHATLAGHDGACVGGHVAPGCVDLRLRADPAGARRRAAGARATTRSPACRSGAASDGRSRAGRARTRGSGRARGACARCEGRRWCRKGDLNPHEVIPSLGPQPSASTNSAIPTLRDREYRRSPSRAVNASPSRVVHDDGRASHRTARPSAAPPSSASRSPRPWSAETVAPTDTSGRV